MKTLILDGSSANDPLGAQIASALQANLAARNWTSETIILREQKIGNCTGDFFCWIRKPGVCNTNDDNRIIAEKIVQSDLVVYLTPVTFGGYSSELKRAVDHQIQNILPFFANVNGEVHHQPRYVKYPNMLTIGWGDPSAEAVFRHLVHRNAINLYAPTSVCGLVNQEADLEDQLTAWLDQLQSGISTPAPDLPSPSIAHADSAPIRRAILLVGSPRTKKSTSASLGGYLMNQLSARGIETEMLQIYTTFNSAERTRLAFEKLDQADLIVLAFPLYVDSLPAPVIAALEVISAHRAEVKTVQHFAAIANCGFPEASHNDTALAICGEFAAQSGMDWLGSLSLGAGEGLVHGVPLNELGGQGASFRKSLDLAADALADGKSIPPQARDLLAKPFIPNWLYKVIGGFGWKQQAKKYGARKSLRRQPYLVK
jgi:multimeric flavodoxin WrbA